MRKHFAALAALSALALPASAQASVTITAPGTDPIPAGPVAAGNWNALSTYLSGQGLTLFASSGANIVLDASHVLTF